jgi:hypothetical protein
MMAMLIRRIYIVMLPLLLLVMHPLPPSTPNVRVWAPIRLWGAGRRHRGLGRLETPRGSQRHGYNRPPAQPNRRQTRKLRAEARGGGDG